MDTIFILFKKSKYNIKIDYPEEKDGFKNRSYIFNYKKKDAYYFEFKKNLDRIIETKVVNKLFLKRNKEKIIKIDNLSKFNYEDIQCELFTRSKKFYIIDLTEKKDQTYTIYRVIHFNSCPSRE